MRASSRPLPDSAAGYAGLTLMPPGAGVLTAEFKINLLAPAQGDRLVAQGRVIKSGRSLTIAEADVFAETDGLTEKGPTRKTRRPPHGDADEYCATGRAWRIEAPLRPISLTCETAKHLQNRQAALAAPALASSPEKAHRAPDNTLRMIL